MKTSISRRILQIAAAATCFVMLFATVLSAKAKAKAKSEPNAPAIAVAAEPNKPAETAADSVAVTVNGVAINESKIDAQLQPQLQKIGTQLPEQYKKQLRRQILEKMIIEQLLDEKVKAAKITISEEEVMERIKEISSQQQPPLSLEDFKTMVEAYGQSFDDVKLRIQKGLAYQKFMEAQWAGKIDVPEGDAQKYYDENKTNFETPEQIRASHILVKPVTGDPNTDPNQAKAKAKAKTEGLLKQIKGGADFAELAKVNSDDTYSAVQGGDLGFFGRSQMVPAFEKAAFALKPGQVSDIVETQFGYHIIKLTEHKDANTIPFDEAEKDIVEMLTQTKKAEFAEKYIESLKADAKIVYPPGKEPNTPAFSPAAAPSRPDSSKPATEPEEKTSGKKKTSAK
ncbi:MAG: peptidylprolyl isomerase [Phycisphaerae bacterium]|nr:peptidylprolyl isomerase [Phycisphaerae bacterium]MDD5380151.1 peptidylprolyl isomerase [Phycisphaerae bacterium]